MSSTETEGNGIPELIVEKDAVELTRQVFGSNKTLVRYHLSPYSDEQLGYLGSHKRLVLEARSNDSGDIKSHSFFVKAIPYEDPAEAVYVKEKGVFEQESIFYREIVQQLTKNNKTEPWTPKCYLAKSDTLVFEDLSLKGYSNRGYIFNDELVRSALSTVAQLHASSLMAEYRMGKSFIDVYPNAFKEMTFMGAGKNLEWYMSAVDAMVPLAEYFQLDSSKVLPVCNRLFNIIEKERNGTAKKNKKFSVITHGDLWGNNMMFNKEQPPHCKLVDFQFTRYAPLAQDIVMLLHLCTTTEFRRKHERGMIHFYYAELERVVRSNSSSVEIPSIERLYSDIEEQRLRAVVTAAVYCQTVFLSRKFAADFLDDPAEFERIIYGDKIDQLLILLRRDEFYRSRIEESIRELELCARCIMSTTDDCKSATDSFEQCDPLNKVPQQNEEFFRKIVTPEEVTNLARSAISADVEIINFYLRPFTAEKLGFLASHQCLVIESRRPRIAETVMRYFFVKAMPYDVPGQVAYIEEKGAFRKEVGFFKRVVPILMENFKSEDWVPRAHLVKDDVIVFDDMKHEGFSNKPRFLDLESVKSAVACVARYHVASMLAFKRLGKPLNEVFPEIFEESEYRRTPGCLKWFNTAMNLVTAVGEELGLDVSSMRQTSQRVFDLAEPKKEKHNVASHGDLWSNNLLFDASNRCRLVDFQLVRYAPLAHDVMQLIYLTMTRELRERSERQVIEHYYVKLVQCLSENGFRGEVPTFQELLNDVEEQRLWGILAAVLNFPTMLMDSKLGATIMSDLDACQPFFLRDRKPFVDKIMSQDPVYERRIKDTVREFAEICDRYKQ